MSSLFIDGVLLDEVKTNILIEDTVIAGIGSELPIPADAVSVCGEGLAVFPSLANMHTHAAMSLLRGYGNDLPLMKWLRDYIWPAEKRLDDDSVYWGARLAFTEMVKSGTTLCSDMYFRIPAAARAAADVGLRAILGVNIFGDGDDLSEQQVEDLLTELESCGGRVKLAVAPHAVYTVSEKGFIHSAQLCQRYRLLLHTHLSETEGEVEDCLRQHGCRPAEYLERMGVFDLVGDRFSAAHGLYLSEEEIALLGRRCLTVTHNPCSNLKLGSGHFFPYTELRDAGANVALGTDGCASSNNLDLIEAARFMAYLQKGVRLNPSVLPAEELLGVASRNGFRLAGVDAGDIAVGKEADLMLIDTRSLAFTPNNNTLANLLYSGHGNDVDTVICGGRILMLNRQIDGEEETKSEASRFARRVLNQ